MSIFESFQYRVHAWISTCFPVEIVYNKKERNHRFIEEALELVQSLDYTVEEAHKMVDYVYSRKRGDTIQEVGGVLVCLAALCDASSIEMDEAGEIELKRIWKKMPEIREKHNSKSLRSQNEPR